MKRIPLDWRLAPDEWDSRMERVCIPLGTNRKRGEYLSMVTDGLEKAKAMVKTVIECLGKRDGFTAEDVVRAYNERSGMSGWIDYLHKQAKILIREGCDTTRRHYKSLGRSLETFLNDENPP